MSYSISANGDVPSLTAIAAVVNDLDSRVTAASTLTFPFINITQAPYNVKFDGTDETSKWQAALTAAAATGGTLYGGPGAGMGNSLVSGAGLSVSIPTTGFHIWLPGVRIQYSGTGTGLTVQGAGAGANSQLPAAEIYGLNIICSGAAAAGIHLDSAAHLRLRDTFVCATGSVVDAYVFHNSGDYFSENASMNGCGASGFTNSAVAFSVTSGHPSSNSFARFVCRDLFVASTSPNSCVFDVQSGSVYDAQIQMIRGNFSGATFVRIRAGAGMEGSRVSGFHTETGGSVGPSGLILVDSPVGTKLPIIEEYGNYVKGTGWIGPWITGGSPYTAFTPAGAGFKTLDIGSPVAITAPLTAASLQAAGGPVKSVLQAGSLVTGSGTQSGTVTTSNVLWVASGSGTNGAAGEVTVFASASLGAGGCVCKAAFAGEGAAVTFLAQPAQNVTRPGYFPLTISNLKVNPTGTVSFDWQWGSTGAPSITMTWTVVAETMPI